MNERIRELANEASHQSPDGYAVTIPYSKDFAEKFAELIVRECIKIVEYKGNKSGKDHPVGFNLLDAAQDIKEHFGVEE